MNKIITIISILFSTSTFANINSLPTMTLSGLESQAVTPIITEDPDQTIHIQPNTSAPSQLTSSVTTPDTTNSDITVPNTTDGSGSTTSDTDINTNLNSTPSDATTSKPLEDTYNSPSDDETDINTNFNNTPTTPTPATLNNDSGTANDATNTTSIDTDNDGILDEDEGGDGTLDMGNDTTEAIMTNPSN
ncbi:Uncharacterised protein [Legionella beliardensis]|uniref:Uncharacterized protein n=1 Tax=Legionella beliardensis TaxID=91822 RepID=A0A378HYM1_9GAMM|nr:hypothetical protein [Legionella beliardensis]STX27570.1 Uncharacterised protein [Legionella beliardensis]